MDMLPKGDIAINKHDKEKKGDIAMTLGDAISDAPLRPTSSAIPAVIGSSPYPIP